MLFELLGDCCMGYSFIYNFGCCFAIFCRSVFRAGVSLNVHSFFLFALF